VREESRCLSKERPNTRGEASYAYPERKGEKANVTQFETTDGPSLAGEIVSPTPPGGGEKKQRERQAHQAGEKGVVALFRGRGREGQL